jgi:hypothetical protein
MSSPVRDEVLISADELADIRASVYAMEQLMPPLRGEAYMLALSRPLNMKAVAEATGRMIGMVQNYREILERHLASKEAK